MNLETPQTTPVVAAKLRATITPIIISVEQLCDGAGS